MKSTKMLIKSHLQADEKKSGKQTDIPNKGVQKVNKELNNETENRQHKSSNGSVSNIITDRQLFKGENKATLELMIDAAKKVEIEYNELLEVNKMLQNTIHLQRETIARKYETKIQELTNKLEAKNSPEEDELDSKYAQGRISFDEKLMSENNELKVQNNDLLNKCIELEKISTTHVREVEALQNKYNAKINELKKKIEAQTSNIVQLNKVIQFKTILEQHYQTKITKMKQQLEAQNSVTKTKPNNKTVYEKSLLQHQLEIENEALKAINKQLTVTTNTTFQKKH